MPSDYRKPARRHVLSRRARRERRHLWYARITVGAIVALIATVLIVFHSVLLPFVIAGVIVYVLEPLVRRLHRRGLPRIVSVAVAYLLFFAGVALFWHYLVPKLQHESKKIIGKLHTVVRDSPTLFKRFEDSVEQLLAGTGDTESLPSAAPLPAALKWGFGPDLARMGDLAGGGQVPALEPIAFAPDAQRWLRDPDVRLQEEEPAPEPLTPDLESARNQSNLLITRLRDGLYGVEVRDSAVQVETLGDGRYNLLTSTERQEVSAVANVRSGIMRSLRAGLEKLAAGVLGSFFSTIQGVLTGIIRAFVAVLFTFLVAAFVLLDFERLKAFFLGCIPPRHRGLVSELFGRLDASLGGVVRGQLLICLVNGVLSGIGFAIFIPEYAIVMAILAAVMSLIPVFGTIISTIPAVLIGLTDSFPTALAVLGWVLGIHFIEAYLLNPKIIGTQARINPVLVIFVIVAGGALFGATGALLATPATAIVQAFVQTAWHRARPYFMRDL